MFKNQNQEKNATAQAAGSFLKNGRFASISGMFSGLHGAAAARFIAEAYLKGKTTVAVVTPSVKAAESLMEDLRFFLRDREVRPVYFGAYNLLPFKSISYHNTIAGDRIRTLYQLATASTPSLLVTPVDALLQKLPPKNDLCNYAELLIPHEETDRDQLIAKLVSGGYSRSAIVEEPGDFSVRGGILDLFTPTYSEPLRIEFFGDMVESIRFFSTASQRTREEIAEAIILPARESILKMSEMDRVINRIRTQAASTDIPLSHVNEIIEKIRTEGIFPGIESLLPLIYPELDTLFDYLPAGAWVTLMEPSQLEKNAKSAWQEAKENYTHAVQKKRLCVSPEQHYLDWPALSACFQKQKTLHLSMLPPAKRAGEDEPESVHFSIEDNTIISLDMRHAAKETDHRHLFKPLAEWLTRRKNEGLATLIVCESESQAAHVRDIIEPYGLKAPVVEGLPDLRRAGGRMYLCTGKLSGGFVWPAESLAIITEREIFGVRRPKKKRAAQKAQSAFISFEDLKAGELVVHTEHGIGRYEGLEKLTVNGAVNDFLHIVYKDNDRLYLPVDRMGMVQKYMGIEGSVPVLDKMGGASWGRVKQKVKKSVEKMAGKLLKLYARRKIEKGTVCHTDASAMQSFEEGFPYEETPDQRRAIEDVLSDMARPQPMDRLICGDVGYGKTEVALRAAFSVVWNHKQVAMLAPTTVLAEQHFETFSQRFEDHPVQIACLNRFRTAKEQRQIIEGLASGAIDIVLGTHRLLQKDVMFNDLGLVILDEEQRFGVRHKEKLKSFRASVDVLAMTATPIPRTLHMSLTGIRDISIISTPPEDRRPIITYISEFDDTVIADAIRKELQRKGQMFFVHNHVQSICRMAEFLQKLVPEVRLETAHGQMNENALERVMFRFINKEIDLLLCTTIIESGLDVPAANTILVNRADRFGLAQMYQLRGRVGRGDEQAYAYLFIPNETLLTKDAQKRLKVLMEHNDLGAGFQIAMNDLKIRGGGSILGASQSGHISAVGYDMFLKLMEEAVAELKGEPVIEDLEPEINITLSAYIAEDYISDIDQRMTAYRRLSGMSSLKEISDFKAELIDRFGPMPEETGNLLLKIMLKVLAVRAGVRRIDMTETLLLLYFSKAHQRNPFGIVDMISDRKNRFQLTPEEVLKAGLTQRSLKGRLLEAKNILKEITQRVNG